MRRKDIFLSMLRKAAGIDKDPFDLDEQEIMQAGRQANEKAGTNRFSGTKHIISVPIAFKSEEETWLESRDIGTQGYLIQNEQRYLIPPVSDTSIFIRAGALFLTGQMKNVMVPCLSGILAQWVDDESDPDSDGSEITPTGATFTNKRLYAQIDVPRIMIEQGGPEFDLYIRACLSAAIADKLDSTLGGVAAGSTNKPQGMGYAITTGLLTKHAAITPNWSDIVDLENSLSALNFPIRDMAFITNPSGRRILEQTEKTAANALYIWDKNEINGYPAYSSNALSSIAGSDGAGDLLLFGNWKDLCILQMGAWDVLIDPFTLKRQAKIQLNVNAYFDFHGLRGSVATSEDESTEPNQYAYSFAALAIK